MIWYIHVTSPVMPAEACEILCFINGLKISRICALNNAYVIKICVPNFVIIKQYFTIIIHTVCLWHALMLSDTCHCTYILQDYSIGIEARSLIAKFMGPTWGPPGPCRPQVGLMLAPWTLLSGITLVPMKQPWVIWINKCKSSKTIYYNNK